MRWTYCYAHSKAHLGPYVDREGYLDIDFDYLAYQDRHYHAHIDEDTGLHHSCEEGVFEDVSVGWDLEG